MKNKDLIQLHVLLYFLINKNLLHFIIKVVKNENEFILLYNLI